MNQEGIVRQVRERYERIALGELPGCCGGEPEEPAAPASCCGSTEERTSRAIGYDKEELATLPEGTNLGLGCGAPVAQLALREGETVLDLGSGPGLDALLAARRVGPSGRVIGVDMTPAMIDRARAAAREAGIGWVEFRHGRLEALPVDGDAIDAVTSNCVINLVPDKEAVFREIARVLKPGGRLVVSDIVLERPLPEAVATDILAWVGCVAGAVLRDRYFGMLQAAGLRLERVFDDFDYLARVEAALPAEVAEKLQRDGLGLETMAGAVHSVTYEARRPL